MSDITRLLVEPQFYRSKKHNEKLSEQFLLECYQEHRADHHTVNNKGSNQSIRLTLERKFKPDIEHLLSENR